MILKLLNESQHDENYKLLHRDRWEATVKKLAQLETEITNNDEIYKKNLEQASVKLKNDYKQEAQKQISEYKEKLKQDLEQESKKSLVKEQQKRAELASECKVLTEKLLTLETSKTDQAKIESLLQTENADLKSSIKVLQNQIVEYKSKTNQMNTAINDLELRIKKFQGENLELS